MIQIFHCGNKDYREFFAEVVYHAGALVGPLGWIKYNNALIADMTCYKSGSDFVVEMGLNEIYNEIYYLEKQENETK